MVKIGVAISALWVTAGIIVAALALLDLLQKI
jgi:hypothetical protein